MSTTLPMDWPPLRDAAEAMAAQVFSVPDWYEDVGCTLWGGLTEVAERRAIRHCMSLLADLTRPVSRDYWSRWLAEKVGLSVGATAPSWEYALKGWWLDDWHVFNSDGWNLGDGETVHLIPGIYAITDPAEALRLALLSVVPQ